MLVDLEKAKGHLRIGSDDDDGDDDIVSKIEQASSIVLNYLKLPNTTWDDDDDETVPLTVEAAVLLVMEALFDGGDPLSQTVKDLLHRYRDPALA